MKVSLIVCHTRNRVIGAGSRMPWHLPADLKRFRQTTMGHAIVMGRKTLETLDGPLPGRRNIVMSRRRLQRAGFEAAADIGALEEMVGDERFFVIGGGEIYRLFLPLADTIHRTLIEAELDGDTFFPELEPREWRVRETERHAADERNRYALRFSKLERVAAPAKPLNTANRA